MLDIVCVTESYIIIEQRLQSLAEFPEAWSSTSHTTYHTHERMKNPENRNPAVHLCCQFMPHRTKLNHLACRSTPDVFAQKIPTHPSAKLSEPDIHEYPTHIHRRPPCNLASEPQIHAIHSLHLSIYQPSPH